MKKLNVAWYDGNGQLIDTFSGLTEMYRETGIQPSAIYRSNLFGHYLDGNNTFAKYYDGEPKLYFEPPVHAKRGPSDKLTKSQLNRVRAEPRVLYANVVDERNENIKVIKTSMKSISKILDEIGCEKANQIRSMVAKLQNESIIYGIKSERFGVGEELEEEIYQKRRKT